MAYTDIDKPDEYFNTKLYTGNGSTGHSITGVGFQPDWVWIKERNSSVSYHLYDSVRGATKRLESDNTDAESTAGTFLTSFDSDGFTLGSNGGLNGSSDTYVAWNWLASNTTASNTDGSITSTVSANTTSGFSIVSWTGTGSNATVGHGLSSTPKMVICKRRDANDAWFTYNENIGSGAFLALNSTIGSTTAGASGLWNNTSPTSSVFTVGTNGGVNASGGTYIAYCFAEKKGFSKLGSYTGNGNADGTFVYTGFKPAFVLVRHTDSVGENWFICDNKREGYNAENNRLMPNITSVEIDDSPIDILSNGFKARETGNKVNGSGRNYIYMAFAESPFVTSTGIPTTAR